MGQKIPGDTSGTSWHSPNDIIHNKQFDCIFTVQSFKSGIKRAKRRLEHFWEQISTVITLQSGLVIKLQSNAVKLCNYTPVLYDKRSLKKRSKGDPVATQHYMKSTGKSEEWRQVTTDNWILIDAKKLILE